MVACGAATKRTFKEQGSSGFKGGTVSRLAVKARKTPLLTDSTGTDSGGSSSLGLGLDGQKRRTRKTERGPETKEKSQNERKRERGRSQNKNVQSWLIIPEIRRS